MDENALDLSVTISSVQDLLQRVAVLESLAEEHGWQVPRP
jgi:hypothetical protein